MLYANHPEQMGVCISADDDDTTMTNDSIRTHLESVMKPAEWYKIFYGQNKTKIQAVNADMEKVDYPWDIVMIVSDDMIPVAKGYDDVIRKYMAPDTNGIVWINDGTQSNKLNTLSIMGRAMYNSFGYLYHPDYTSLFCDTEFTDLCKTTLKDKVSYIPQCLIRHEHPQTGFAQKNDALYDRNQKYWTQDMLVYIRRKNYEYDWSILIPTIRGREESLQRLLNSINEKKARICPQLRIDINILLDNREKSIGMKREELLQNAKGKYMSFIDDDDNVTDAYFEDALATLQGSFHVARLRGQIAQYTFTHSLENTLQSPMARGQVFLRPPNHLNVMMTDLAKNVPFRDARRGEDLDWTMRLSQYGLLKNEYKSDDSRIHYIYDMKGRNVHQGTLEQQKTTTYQTMLAMVWTPEGAVTTQSQSRTMRLTSRGFVSR